MISTAVETASRRLDMVSTVYEDPSGALPNVFFRKKIRLQLFRKEQMDYFWFACGS